MCGPFALINCVWPPSNSRLLALENILRKRPRRRRRSARSCRGLRQDDLSSRLGGGGGLSDGLFGGHGSQDLDPALEALLPRRPPSASLLCVW